MPEALGEHHGGGGFGKTVAAKEAGVAQNLDLNVAFQVPAELTSETCGAPTANPEALTRGGNRD